MADNRLKLLGSAIETYIQQNGFGSLTRPEIMVAYHLIQSESTPPNPARVTQIVREVVALNQNQPNSFQQLYREQTSIAIAVNPDTNERDVAASFLPDKKIYFYDQSTATRLDNTGIGEALRWALGENAAGRNGPYVLNQLGLDIAAQKVRDTHTRGDFSNRSFDEVKQIVHQIVGEIGNLDLNALAERHRGTFGVPPNDPVGRVEYGMRIQRMRQTTLAPDSYTYNSAPRYIPPEGPGVIQRMVNAGGQTVNNRNAVYQQAGREKVQEIVTEEANRAGLSRAERNLYANAIELAKQGDAARGIRGLEAMTVDEAKATARQIMAEFILPKTPQEIILALQVQQQHNPQTAQRPPLVTYGQKGMNAYYAQPDFPPGNVSSEARLEFYAKSLEGADPNGWQRVRNIVVSAREQIRSHTPERIANAVDNARQQAGRVYTTAAPHLEPVTHIAARLRNAIQARLSPSQNQGQSQLPAPATELSIKEQFAALVAAKKSGAANFQQLNDAFQSSTGYGIYFDPQNGNPVFGEMEKGFPKNSQQLGISFEEMGAAIDKAVQKQTSPNQQLGTDSTVTGYTGEKPVNWAFDDAELNNKGNQAGVPASVLEAQNRAAMEQARAQFNRENKVARTAGFSTDTQNAIQITPTSLVNETIVSKEDLARAVPYSDGESPRSTITETAENTNAKSIGDKSQAAGAASAAANKVLLVRGAGNLAGEINRNGMQAHQAVPITLMAVGATQEGVAFAAQSREAATALLARQTAENGGRIASIFSKEVAVAGRSIPVVGAVVAGLNGGYEIYMVATSSQGSFWDKALKSYNTAEAAGGEAVGGLLGGPWGLLIGEALRDVAVLKQRLIFGKEHSARLGFIAGSLEEPITVIAKGVTGELEKEQATAVARHYAQIREALERNKEIAGQAQSQALQTAVVKANLSNINAATNSMENAVNGANAAREQSSFDRKGTFYYLGKFGEGDITFSNGAVIKKGHYVMGEIDPSRISFKDGKFYFPTGTQFTQDTITLPDGTVFSSTEKSKIFVRDMQAYRSKQVASVSVQEQQSPPEAELGTMVPASVIAKERDAQKSARDVI